MDGSAPVTTDAGGTSALDATTPGDASVAPPDGSHPSGDATSSLPDASGAPDVVPDRGSEDGGIRCGSGATAIFCADPNPECCLVLDDAGGDPSYSCVASESDCNGYGIACATDNDCDGTDVCCFFSSGIKCDSEGATACNNKLVCDPSGSSDQCPSGQKCTVAYILADGFVLPYDGCH